MKFVTFLALLFASVNTWPLNAKADEPLRVLILSGCPTYKSEESLPPFQEWLEKNYNVKCTRLVREGNDFANLEKLDECDVLLVFFKRMNLEGEQLERFKKYVTGGKPVVGVRTASHAVQSWLDFDREVLGGNYHGHYDQGIECAVSRTEIGAKHPILNGVELSRVNDALYKNEGHAKDVTVLLEGDIPNQPDEALAWTREINGGRVFYTSLGAQDTFQLPDFRRMLANAIFWTAKRELK
jgi:type 1 glutamine amidotransferase